MERAEARERRSREVEASAAENARHAAELKAQLHDALKVGEIRVPFSKCSLQACLLYPFRRQLLV
jgi:hypothetical protein